MGKKWNTILLATINDPQQASICTQNVSQLANVILEDNNIAQKIFLQANSNASIFFPLLRRVYLPGGVNRIYDHMPYGSYESTNHFVYRIGTENTYFPLSMSVGRILSS